MKKRFTEEQIIGFLCEAEIGLPIKELYRRHGFSEASYCLWRSKFGGMNVSDAKRLKELESENARLKNQSASLHRLRPSSWLAPGASSMQSSQILAVSMHSMRCQASLANCDRR